MTSRPESIRPLLGEYTTFAKAFPMVASITVRALEKGDEIRGGQRDHYRTLSDIPATIPCSNPRCKRGGCELQSTIRMMADAHETQREWTHWCRGDEGSPAGRKQGAPCTHRFEVAITIGYHPNPE